MIDFVHSFQKRVLLKRIEIFLYIGTTNRIAIVMRSKSSFFGLIGLLEMFVFAALVSICVVHHGIAAAANIPSQPNSNPFKGLPEFLNHMFGGRLQEFHLGNLTKPGDGFLSEIRALEVKLRKTNDSNEADTLHIALKAMSRDRPIASQTTFFMTERSFYTEIIPAIEQFQEITHVPSNEKLDDIFIRYVGSRLSLDPNSTMADADAILLLENAKSLNFTSPGRFDRLDIDEINASLKQLAKLHALCIAMRRLQPTLYYSKIDPHIPAVPFASEVKPYIKVVQAFYDDNVNATFPNMTANVRAAIEFQFKRGMDYFKNHNNKQIIDTPYTTFYHRDCHIKNFLYKRDEADGKSVKIKLLDFQMYSYNSFAFDLLHFLFFNVHIDDLRMHFKSFVQYYIWEFVNEMRIVDCPLDDYTNEKMWNEIRDKARLTLFQVYRHICFQVSMIDILNNLTISQPDYNSKPRQLLTHDIAFNRWKCINDLYIENVFLDIEY